ncbi:helix-turn-helix transcriptional regulator [Brevibacillus humidisoli]|uniref:helix-turn-helix transcriptional regulator n=1 Tax=Brevibacillus humidisoli TaxID=2895522 RepID=UPI001E44487B|nr:helix-turn-helix transcriptional regulator [Brevibacillus humidisoli]UFJ39452.1 helix-turn-helix transcriptional regulator [Brevibacillus humidisoli]
MSFRKARMVMETSISDDRAKEQFAELHRRIVGLVSELELAETITLAVEFSPSSARLEMDDDAQDWKLSERQRQVAGMLCRHYSVKRIAETLFVSEHTVKKHIQNMKKALGIEASGADFVYQLQQKRIGQNERILD